MKKPTRYYSKKQEDSVAKALCGTTVSNSGAPMFCCGDVKLNHFLIECKTHTEPKKSVSIKKEWLDKLKEEAISERKPYHSLAFDFGDGTNYFILDERTFKLFVDMINKLEEEEI